MNITGDAAKARIAGQAGYSGTVKSVINSALKRVGRQQYGKYDIDTYTDWKWNQVNPPRELNCWASVVNWAWHGSAINAGWLQRYVNLYVTQITDIMTKNAGMATLEKQDSVRCFLLGQLNSVSVHNVTAATDNVVVPPGRTVFFKNPATGPMSHVALSIGGGMVVSNWRVPSVAEDDNFNLRAGYVHVETIGKLAYLTCQPSCEVRMTPRPFWEMRLCNI